MEMTVGAIRKLIEGKPDDMPVYPDWFLGPPGDMEPAVTVHGFEATEQGLAVLVGLSYLNEEDEDEDEEEEKYPWQS